MGNSFQDVNIDSAFTTFEVEVFVVSVLSTHPEKEMKHIAVIVTSYQAKNSEDAGYIVLWKINKELPQADGWKHSLYVKRQTFPARIDTQMILDSFN